MRDTPKTFRSGSNEALSGGLAPQARSNPRQFSGGLMWDKCEPDLTFYLRLAPFSLWQSPPYAAVIQASILPVGSEAEGAVSAFSSGSDRNRVRIRGAMRAVAKEAEPMVSGYRSAV
jgi:hypothetical protein